MEKNTSHISERALDIKPTKFVLESIFEEAETHILNNEAELPEYNIIKYTKLI